MPVTLTFVGDDWAEVSKQMRAALGAGVVFESQAEALTAVPAETEYEKAPARARAKKDAAPKAEPVAEHPAPAAPKDEAEAEIVNDDAPAALDYETDIKPSVLEIAGKFGRDKVMDLLAKYGVTNAGHVPAEDQPALMADIEAILEG